MNKLTKAQQEKANLFSECLGRYIPQFVGPLWLVKLLDKVLPTSCPFHKVLFVKGQLVLYIPVLCALNPYFEAVLNYRVEKFNEPN